MKYAENKNKNYKRINDKILTAYNEILLSQGNDETNITDLCKRANINRTTFYKHYKDLKDISSELEAEFIYNAFSTRDDIEILDFMKNPCPSFKKLNKNVLENKAFYKTILRPERLSIFIEKISTYLTEDIIKYRPKFTSIFKDTEHLKLAVYSTVGSIASIYSMWLRGNFKMPIEELSKHVCESIKAVYKYAERYKNNSCKECK